MMARVNITDRAQRYRANKLLPVAGKSCLLCGSTRNLVPDHWDGHPDHTNPGNLEVLCKGCNTAKGAAFAKVGRGRLTHQYNPTKGGGAATIGEWMQAVGAITPHVDRGDRGLVSSMSTRDAVDMIRATPQSKRRDFAAKLRRKNPATRENLFGWGKPAPVAVAPRKRRGGLSLSEAGSAAMKAGRKSGDLSDFDSWLERKHLDTRSDGVISRIRDSYARGVAKADADAQNREFVKEKREQAREAARDRREQARDARAAGGGRKAKAAAAASSGYASAPDEETIQRGFKRGLTLNEILRGNPANMAPGWYSEYTAATKDRAEMNRRQIAENGWNVGKVKRIGDRWGFKYWGNAKKGIWNPATASAEVFEEFHGFAPSETITVTKKLHYHKHLAAAGKLTHLDVWGIDGKGHHVTGFKGAFLAFNETKDQLFIEGGDQAVNLEDFGIRKPHELETLGRLTDIGYQTNKTHLGDEGGEAVYVHKFRSTNRDGRHVVVKIARYPDLIYDVRNEQLLFSGGSYEILREGINK